MSRAGRGLRQAAAAARQVFWWAEAALVCALLLSTIGVSALRIALRLAHSRLDIMWADAFLKHSVLWITLLGAGLATKDRNHINIDIVGRLLKGRWKSGCQTLLDLVSAAVCAGAAWFCGEFVLSQREAFNRGSWDSAGTIFAHVPAWYAQAIMPAAFALMTARFLFQAGEDAVAAWQGREIEPPTALPLAAADAAEAPADEQEAPSC